jgi:hypothetical protein
MHQLVHQGDALLADRLVARDPDDAVRIRATKRTARDRRGTCQFAGSSGKDRRMTSATLWVSDSALTFI